MLMFLRLKILSFQMIMNQAYLTVDQRMSLTGKDFDDIPSAHFNYDAIPLTLMQNRYAERWKTKTSKQI